MLPGLCLFVYPFSSLWKEGSLLDYAGQLGENASLGRRRGRKENIKRKGWK